MSNAPTPTTKTTARRRKTAKPCTCPQCPAGEHTNPDGVYHCKAGREFVAYSDGQHIAAASSSHDTAASLLYVEQMLRDHRADQAKAERIEAAAAAADLAHDVAQASTDADVIAALTDATCIICGAKYEGRNEYVCNPCGLEIDSIITPAQDPANIANAALPVMPPFILPVGRGFSWAGCPDVYPSFLDADDARKIWMEAR